MPSYLNWIYKERHQNWTIFQICLPQMHKIFKNWRPISYLGFKISSILFSSFFHTKDREFGFGILISIKHCLAAWDKRFFSLVFLFFHIKARAITWISLPMGLTQLVWWECAWFLLIQTRVFPRFMLPDDHFRGIIKKQSGFYCCKL